MLPLPAMRTCSQGMHNQTAKVRDLQCQPRNQGMSTEERKGRNSGTSMCQLLRKTRRSLSKMPSSSTSSSSNEAKDNHSAQKRGTSTTPEEKINHHNSRPGNQATSTTAKAAHPSTKAMSVNQSSHNDQPVTPQRFASQPEPPQSDTNKPEGNQHKSNLRNQYPSRTVHQRNRSQQHESSATTTPKSSERSSSMQVPGADIQRSSSEQGSQNSSRFSQHHHPDHRGGTQPATVRDIKLLHFNCQGANDKKPAVEHAVSDKNFDIIYLQDTRLEPSKENQLRSKFNLADFDIYHRPKSENCHSIWTAIRRDFPSENISANFDFGPKTEQISIRVHLKSSTIIVHNIYSLDGKPDIRKAIADTEPSILCGDFNAHHRVWGPTQDRLGESLLEQVESSTRHAILNTGEPTHISGTGIDITIASNNIAAKSEWSVHPYLVSDHNAIQTTIRNTPLPPPEALTLRWRLDKADWSSFKSAITEHMVSHPPPEENQPLEDKAEYITDTINKAAGKSIPRSKPGPRRQNAWYYNNTMKVTKNEVNYRLKCHRHSLSETTKAKLM